MKTLLKILNWFFVTLGVIFLILIIIVAYIIIADPFELKPILKMLKLPAVTAETTSQVADKNPLLTADQEKTLETFGVDPAALPTAITPEMEKCFREKLGEARVNEILKSGQPTVMDFFNARSCINN